MITPAEFARKVGITRQGVAKAIKSGRIFVYDETGMRVDASYEGRKFVNPDEAFEAFKLSRARIDDAALAAAATELDGDLAEAEAPASADKPPSPPSAVGLIGAKSESEEVRRDLLKLRLDKERGLYLSRGAYLAALEEIGRKVARRIQGLPHLAEQIHAQARQGGQPAVAAFLQAQVEALLTGIADDVATPGSDDDGAARPQ